MFSGRGILAISTGTAVHLWEMAIVTALCAQITARKDKRSSAMTPLQFPSNQGVTTVAVNQEEVG